MKGRTPIGVQFLHAETQFEAPAGAVRLVEPLRDDTLLCRQEERIVARDNTVGFDGLRLRLPESPPRHHWVKAQVRVHAYLRRRGALRNPG